MPENGLDEKVVVAEFRERAMPIRMVNVIGKTMGKTKLSSRSLDTILTTHFHFSPRFCLPSHYQLLFFDGSTKCTEFKNAAY